MRVLAVLDFVLMLIGTFVVACVFWHWIGMAQLVVCYGPAPTCDEFQQEQPR